MTSTDQGTDKGTDTKLAVKPETTIEPAAERRMRRWDPFEMFDEMQQEMARFWSQALPIAPRAITRPLRRMSIAPTNWMPTIDVYEKDNRLMVKAELPGMNKEDIDVHIDQGDLVIKGERKLEREVKDEDFYRMERSYGSFYRRVPLGFDADPSQVSAKYNDGVLEVSIPKPRSVPPTPQKIPLS